MRVQELLTHVVKLHSSCIVCGEPDPSTLEFHHLDPTVKKFAIGDAVKQRVDIKLILEELLVCEIICANCHRKHHAKFGHTNYPKLTTLSSRSYKQDASIFKSFWRLLQRLRDGFR